MLLISNIIYYIQKQGIYDIINIMYLLGLEIRKDRREKKYSMLACYGCGKTLFVAKDNLRVYNYCTDCK